LCGRIASAALYYPLPGSFAGLDGVQPGATALQVLFEELQIASSMMIATSKRLSGVILIGAGSYQWSQVKDKCLAQCRSPIQFITGHWRAGRFGALCMGVTHGLYCVACCWTIVLLLFVGGVMKLLWVALIAGHLVGEADAARPPG
jgi:predicted metal-binding membrane protein